MTRSASVLFMGIGLVLLPAAAGAGEPVTAPRSKPCPRHGAGFVTAPGSNTCVRLSGRIAADLIVRSGHERPAPIVAPTGRLSIDTRTETEFGPVRTFVRIGGRR